MPLTSVALVLHSKLPNRGPDIVALLLSDILLRDLTLTQACQLTPPYARLCWIWCGSGVCETPKARNGPRRSCCRASPTTIDERSPRRCYRQFDAVTW